MKTLHFISSNSCFVSTHVVVRFTHDYRDFVAGNDYAILIQIPDLFKWQPLKNVFLTLHCSGPGGSLTALKPTRKHLQLSTDNKKDNLLLQNAFKRSKEPSYWCAQGGVYGK